MKISRAEMDVLRVVMDREPVTLREVADAMNVRKEVALSTVQTLLARLHSKGHIRREQVLGVWQYSLSMVRPALEKSLVDDFVETILGGSLSPFVAYLNERADLKPSEIKAFEELIDRLDEESK
jgi:predicted transcriptional regulator